MRYWQDGDSSGPAGAYFVREEDDQLAKYYEDENHEWYVVRQKLYYGNQGEVPLVIPDGLTNITVEKGTFTVNDEECYLVDATIPVEVSYQFAGDSLFIDDNGIPQNLTSGMMKVQYAIGKEDQLPYRCTLMVEDSESEDTVINVLKYEVIQNAYNTVESIDVPDEFVESAKVPE